jgi:hypothetical protein
MPLDTQPIPKYLLHLLYPNCCFIGIGSNVVGPDLQLDLVSHLSLLIQ